MDGHIKQRQTIINFKIHADVLVIKVGMQLFKTVAQHNVIFYLFIVF